MSTIAHFHAEYQQFDALSRLIGAITGQMPRRALNLIWAWLDEHRAELKENWELARLRQPLKPIEPLP